MDTGSSVLRSYQLRIDRSKPEHTYLFTADAVEDITRDHDLDNGSMMNEHGRGNLGCNRQSGEASKEKRYQKAERRRDKKSLHTESDEFF